MNSKAMLSYRKAAVAALIVLLLALAMLALPSNRASAEDYGALLYKIRARVVGGHGSVSPTFQHCWKHGTASIDITPNSGYQIAAIIDNEVLQSISNPYVLRDVRKDHSVDVVFKRNTFTVNASVSGGHGTVEPSTQKVRAGQSAWIDITADPGWRIASITDNGDPQPVADPYVIDDVTADHDVEVSFTDRWVVNAYVSGGHGSVNPPSQSVTAEGAAAINITPDAHYEIDTVTDNGAVVPGPSNPYVIMDVRADHDVIVTFRVIQHTVTAAAPGGPGGNGTVTPLTQTVADGGTAVIDLIPNPGYHTATIDDNGPKAVVDPYRITNVMDNHDVFVTFAADQYTVTASVDGGNGTATPPVRTVAYNDPAVIHIAAYTGFAVASITDNGASQALTDTYTIDPVQGNHDVVVTFSGVQRMVAATVAGGHGTVSPTAQLVTSGGNAVPIVMTPEAGYHIATVTDNGVSKPATSPYQLNGVVANHLVIVTFEADHYTVNAAVAGPGGSVDPATQDVAPGGTAVINIHPEAGYHIEAIVDEGALPPIANPYVITGVHEDHQVYVVFDTTEFVVTAAVAGGNGTVLPLTQTVTYGESAEIDINPDHGYHIATIVDNGAPVEPADPYYIDNVQANHDVTVTFSTNQYPVFAEASTPHGSVAPASQMVASGGTAVVNIIADTGYHIESISDNGESKTVTGTYVINNVTTFHDVDVQFSINEYTALATVAGGNGTVDPEDQSVPYGDTAVINLEPDPGYHPAIIIDNGDLVPVTNPYFIPDATDDHNVIVIFESDEMPTHYLAEGSTNWGFSTTISIENPNAEPLNAQLTYMLSNGSTAQQMVGLPPLSQISVNPADTIGGADFSTQVTCLQGKTIAVDRTMTWTGPGARSSEGHASVGVSSPQEIWYLPEGSSGYGFETWTLVENPNDAPTNITMTYMIEGSGPREFDRTLPAHSRTTYDMNADIGAQNASTQIESDLPVVAERSMYRNNRREGSCSIGTSDTARTYYLAEGSTAWGFTNYVLVQNPNDVEANVTLTCMTPGGPKVMKPFVMPPNTRRTVNMNDLLPNTDFSTMVTSDQDIVAERAMYWGAGTPAGEAMHDSIGLDAAHGTFYLPAGQTSGGVETFTLVQNPNDVPVEVLISYLYNDGSGSSYFISTVPPNSRSTYNMAANVPSGKASIAVTCLTGGKNILAERSMYWNNRGAGTDTIGNWTR